MLQPESLSAPATRPGAHRTQVERSLHTTKKTRCRVPAELGQESQESSCLRKGTPLASRGAQGVSGPLLSCVWNLRVFPEMHDGDSAPSCCAFTHRVAFEVPSPLAPAPHPRKPHLPLAPRTPPRSDECLCQGCKVVFRRERVQSWDRRVRNRLV